VWQCFCFPCTGGAVFAQGAARPKKAGFLLFNAVAVSLLEGDLTRALDEAELAVSYGPTSGMPFGYVHNNILQAIVRGKSGEIHAALQQIEATREASPRVNSPVLNYCSFLAEANVRHWRGEPDLALRVLQSALDVAKEDGRCFVPCWQLREEAALLFNRALDAGIHPDLVSTLIRKTRLAPPPPDLASDAWPFPVKVYTLGRFSALLDDVPLEYSGKAQKKPFELLKAMIALGGRAVGVEHRAGLVARRRGRQGPARFDHDTLASAQALAARDSPARGRPNHPESGTMLDGRLGL
jgi:LuxR family maltose regulon positive regulatory protein